MKKLWLVRHGESKAQTGEEQSIDADLSKLGVKQSKALASFLAGRVFDRVFVSPLRRARFTFELSGLPKDKVIFDSRLVEYMPQGQYANSGLLPYNCIIEHGIVDKHNAWEMVFAERINNFWADIIAGNADNTIIFTHSGVISTLLALFLGGRNIDIDYNPYNNYILSENASLSIFELFDERDTMKINAVYFWNYCAHLEDLRSSERLEKRYIL